MEHGTETPLRLNIGAGNWEIPGFLPIDRKLGREAYPLEYRDGSVDEIRASHVLEHFSHQQIFDVLKDWYRALKPGGFLRIAVPDFQIIAQQYLEGKNIPVQGYVMGGHIDCNDHHGCIFDREALTDFLIRVGFVDVQPWKSEIEDAAVLPISLNLAAYKPAPLPKELKICCAMSVPRLGFQDNFFSVMDALSVYGIMPERYSGAFWGQCLERTMAGMVERGCDYIVCIDYDTIFSKQNFDSLIWAAIRNPQADAIAPLQMKRSSESRPLFTIRGPDGKYMPTILGESLDQPLVKASTAHFGMTVIRVEALKRMAHPWFLGQPDKDGAWSNDRVDDDVYFWKKWEQVGNSLYIAPRIVVGHGEFMVMWPDRDFNPIWQFPSDYFKTGTPEEVWR